MTYQEAMQALNDAVYAAGRAAVNEDGAPVDAMQALNDAVYAAGRAAVNEDGAPSESHGK